MKDILSNKKVIVFDGVCTLCNKYVLFVANNDKKDVFRFISLQNKKVLQELDRREFSRNNNESILLIDKSNIKVASSAVLSICYDLRFPYNILYIGIIIPPFIRNVVYNYIAKYRYNIFGKVSHCSIIRKDKSIKLNKKLLD